MQYTSSLFIRLDKKYKPSKKLFHKSLKEVKNRNFDLIIIFEILISLFFSAFFLFLAIIFRGAINFYYLPHLLSIYSILILVTVFKMPIEEIDRFLFISFFGFHMEISLKNKRMERFYKIY